LLFPWSKDTSSIIDKVCETQVYIPNDRPSYEVSVPLVSQDEFKAYHVVVVPIPVNDHKLIYIRREKFILWVDKTLQYYYFSSDFELQKCKEPTKMQV